MKEKGSDLLFDKIDKTLSPILHGEKGPDVFNNLTLYYGSCIVSLFMINKDCAFDLIRELDKTVVDLIEKYQRANK